MTEPRKLRFVDIDGDTLRLTSPTPAAPPGADALVAVEIYEAGDGCGMFLTRDDAARLHDWLAEVLRDAGS